MNVDEEFNVSLQTTLYEVFEPFYPDLKPFEPNKCFRQTIKIDIRQKFIWEKNLLGVCRERYSFKVISHKNSAAYYFSEYYQFVYFLKNFGVKNAST